ncbi:hypothetical protein L484_025689 [Morus notabilis]|uniref:FLZ-type domain-containing protein n=1 Tax=Morus notabilis TaxID=981085 RepID=W9RE87_9ROSA|nr:hypothetical protein L484_025689 [Morus notabilis]
MGKLAHQKMRILALIIMISILKTFASEFSPDMRSKCLEDCKLDCVRKHSRVGVELSICYEFCQKKCAHSDHDEKYSAIRYIT